jgi:hypothetical protein
MRDSNVLIWLSYMSLLLLIAPGAVAGLLSFISEHRHAHS